MDKIKQNTGDEDLNVLNFVLDRMKNVYGENENRDFMLMFKELIDKLENTLMVEKSRNDAVPHVCGTCIHDDNYLDDNTESCRNCKNQPAWVFAGINDEKRSRFPDNWVISEKDAEICRERARANDLEKKIFEIAGIVDAYGDPVTGVVGDPINLVNTILNDVRNVVKKQ